MTKAIISDREKLKKIIEKTKMSRSSIARLLEVSYKTVYRWIDKGTRPHPAESQRIDELFKEYVDLREFVKKLKEDLGNPIKIIKNPCILRRHRV